MFVLNNYNKIVRIEQLTTKTNVRVEQLTTKQMSLLNN